MDLKESIIEILNRSDPFRAKKVDVVTSYAPSGVLTVIINPPLTSQEKADIDNVLYSPPHKRGRRTYTFKTKYLTNPLVQEFIQEDLDIRIESGQNIDQ